VLRPPGPSDNREPNTTGRFASPTDLRQLLTMIRKCRISIQHRNPLANMGLRSPGSRCAFRSKEPSGNNQMTHRHRVLSLDGSHRSDNNSASALNYLRRDANSPESCLYSIAVICSETRPIRKVVNALVSNSALILLNLGTSRNVYR
jgi:hypothetical protein